MDGLETGPGEVHSNDLRAPTGPREWQSRPALRVFMFADIRGYTFFTAQRGAEAAAQLVARFRQVATGPITVNGGSIRDTAGDEILAEFASPRDAVRAAISLQDVCAEATLANPSLPLGVGVGLDVGELGGPGEGVSTDALNMAARLCAAARAGECLASPELVHLAGALAAVAYDNRGRVPLKGLGRRHVVRVRVSHPDRGREAALAPLMIGATERHQARRRRRVVIAGLTIAVVVAGSGTWWLARRTNSPPTIPAQTVGLIDPSGGRLLASVPVGLGPSGIAASGNDVWVANTAESSVSRIDQGTRSVVQRTPVDAGPVAVVVVGADLWVANSQAGTVSEISTQTGLPVADSLVVGNEPTAITAGFGSVWVVNEGDGSLTRIDPSGTTLPKTKFVVESPDGITTGLGSVWVSNRADGTVAQVDPDTMEVTRLFPVGSGPQGIVVSAGGVWVANSLDLTVSHIDPRTGTVTSDPVGDTPTAITSDGGSLWVTDAGDATVAQIDPSTAQVTRRLSVGSSPRGLVATGSGLWVVGQPMPSAAHRGGTLTVSYGGGFPTVDPALVYNPDISPTALSLVYDGLVGLHRTSGAAGYELVPDLAQSLPRPTPDGLRYTFTLRSGIRYSDGTPLQADDVRRGIERSFVQPLDPNNGHPQYLDAIKGAAACIHAPLTPCHLTAGVETNNKRGTVIIHLSRPDPDLLAKLTLPYASATPASAPQPQRNLGGPAFPGTGPYQISDYLPPKLDAKGDVVTDANGDAVVPGHLTLTRNRFFHQWSSVAQPAGFPNVIRWVSGASGVPDSIAVEDGVADLAGLGLKETAALHRQYPAQVLQPTSPWSEMFVLNTNRPPFDNPQARRAVALALDRTALAASAAEPAADIECRLVPPGYPGYQPGCPADAHVDTLTAAALAKAHIKTPVNLYIWPYPRFEAKAADLAKALGRLGVTVNIIARHEGYGQQGPTDPVPGKPVNMYGFAWGPDFPSVTQYYTPLFACPDRSTSMGAFCDPALDNMVRQAKADQFSNPGQASQLWKDAYSRLDAADVVLATGASPSSYLVSPRIRNFQASPLTGTPLLDQMWVQ